MTFADLPIFISTMLGVGLVLRWVVQMVGALWALLVSVERSI